MKKSDFSIPLKVISRKDQAQYWYRKEKPYSYVSVDHFVKKFKESQDGGKLEEELSKPFDKSESHKSALSFTGYSLPKWELFKACALREFLLMKRNSFIYVFKSLQVASFISEIDLKNDNILAYFLLSFLPSVSAASDHCNNNNDCFTTH